MQVKLGIIISNYQITSDLIKIDVIQYETPIPFLYSDKQIINITDDISSYELKFKIGKFNNEKIFLKGFGYNSIVLYNYKIENKELIFEINKEKLEEILQAEEEHFLISTYINFFETINITTISDIIIRKENIFKKLIQITITKLLTQTGSLNEFFAYETDITFMSNIISNMTLFQLQDTNISIIFKKNRR